MFELVHFDKFTVRVLATIPKYGRDRNFNKVCVVSNQLYATNGT